MAEEDLDSYKDISELRKELEVVKGRKDISTKELYAAVQKLADTMSDMLEVFGTAMEQMKMEEKELESDAKKHDMIMAKLDKLIGQNKTIAEGMVAIVDMVKEKTLPAKQRQEQLFKPRELEEPIFKPAEQNPFMKQQQDWKPQQDWQQSPQPMMQSPQPPRQQTQAPPLDFGMEMPSTSPRPRQGTQQQMQPPMMPPMMPPPTMEAMKPPNFDQDFGMEFPPLEPGPSPDLDFLEESKPEEPKKKGLFGLFKK